jgi:hypothetical protein
VPVPDEVFLQVAWPAGEVHTQSATVRGKARPGTTVLVNGREAPVRRDGSFAASVPVRHGENPVSVVAESIDGKTRASKGQVKVNLDGPPLEAKPEDMYKKKRQEGTP